MFSIIYTPTEGDAIQNFSKVFRKPEGCFLNVFDQDRVEDNLAQWGDSEDIDYIVVTDGEEVSPHSSDRIDSERTEGDRYLELVTKVRIDITASWHLLIGWIGVGGILISVAKLVLTTLCAGIHPSRTLPVVLDCGTDV